MELKKKRNGRNALLLHGTDTMWEQCPLVEGYSQTNAPTFFFSLSRMSFVSFNVFFQHCFLLVFQTHTHTHRCKGVSYRDTIVCAVSKGDLLKELWCAVISPTSVNSTHAGACDQGGWEAGLQFRRPLYVTDCTSKGIGITTRHESDLSQPKANWWGRLIVQKLSL